jgi:hypothetical protein
MSVSGGIRGGQVEWLDKTYSKAAVGVPIAALRKMRNESPIMGATAYRQSGEKP